MTSPVAAVRSLAVMIPLLGWLMLGGLYQRVVLYPAVFLWPRRRPALTSPFFRAMCRGITALLRLGGARLRRCGVVPTDGPVLVLMNHQSVLDIVTVGLMSDPYVPLFVTRKRYAYGLPCISPHLRLMGCPVIDPDDWRRALTVFREAGRALHHGLLVFPEGHRTKDGTIGPFKTAGLLAVLRERRLPVYLLVTDGFCATRRFVDFLFGVGEIRGETEVLGPFSPPAEADALPAFLAALRETMVGHLGVMRGRHAAA